MQVLTYSHINIEGAREWGAHRKVTTSEIEKPQYCGDEMCLEG